MSDQNGTISFVTGLLVGFVVSAPVVAWLSPRSGPERRSALNQQTTIIRRKVADTLRKPVEQVQEQIENLKGDSVADSLAEGRAIAAQHQRDNQNSKP